MTENNDILICSSCNEEYSAADFDGIDDEFNEEKPRCPECQEQEFLEGETCEYCDQPAVAYPASGVFLCEDHYEDYCDGYVKND